MEFDPKKGGGIKKTTHVPEKRGDPSVNFMLSEAEDKRRLSETSTDQIVSAIRSACF